MPLRVIPVVLAVALAVLAETAAAESNAGSAAAARPALTAYSKLDPSRVSVSGLSSGGFFAHQFHVAYSDLVDGAAVLAGGPYACAEQIPTALTSNPLGSVIVALSVCSHRARTTFDPFDLWLPTAPSIEDAVATTRAEHVSGRIDDPANLADDRVWLLAGGKDQVVPESTVQALHAFYERMGLAAPDLHLERDADANHGLPIEELIGTSAYPARACGDYELPFLIDCDYDAAQRFLSHLYPQGFNAQAGAQDRDRLFKFDQTEFFDPDDPSVSLGEVGYLYVPTDCLEEAASTESCRLHIAFHGCQQYPELIDDDFYWDAGYNAWAEVNRIVVLYPQTTAWDRSLDPTGLTANPNGCWDWWGYSGPDYHRQTGKQMQAVRAMVERLLPD